MAFFRAKREAIPLWIGLTSKSGGGKTYSALRIARGIAGDKPFAAVDTETRRMSHYADDFTFDVENMEPPFRPGRFLKIAQDAQKAGYPALVIDSFSHEWMGEGGVIDWHDEEQHRMAGENANHARLEALNFPAWRKPKEAHRDMIQGLLQIRMPLIFCFRGKAPAEMKPDPENPRRKIVVEGEFAAITSDDLPYEMTCLLVLSAKKPGAVDLSQPNKISRPVLPFVKDGALLDEAFGAKIAAWARGGGDEQQQPQRQAQSKQTKQESAGDGPTEGTGQPTSGPSAEQSAGGSAPLAPYIVDDKGNRRVAPTIERWTEGWEQAMQKAQQKKQTVALKGLRERNAAAFDELAQHWPEEVADIRRLLDVAIGALEGQQAAA